MAPRRLPAVPKRFAPADAAMAVSNLTKLHPSYLTRALVRAAVKMGAETVLGELTLPMAGAQPSGWPGFTKYGECPQAGGPSHREAGPGAFSDAFVDFANGCLGGQAMTGAEPVGTPVPGNTTEIVALTRTHFAIDGSPRYRVQEYWWRPASTASPIDWEPARPARPRVDAEPRNAFAASALRKALGLPEGSTGGYGDPHVRSERGKAVVIGPRVMPATRPALGAASVRKPPRAGEAERKAQILSQRGMDLFQRAMDVSEAIDILRAVYTALPAKYRTRDATPQRMLLDLYQHAGDIDVPAAVIAVIVNQVVDRFVGGLSRRVGEQAEGWQGRRTTGIAL